MSPPVPGADRKYVLQKFSDVSKMENIEPTVKPIV